MKQRTLGLSVVCSALLFGLGGASVSAQEQEVVIQRVDVHQDGGTTSGEPKVFGMVIGPDGVMQTFGNGDGPMFFAPMGGGAGNFIFSGRQGVPGKFGGLEIIDPARNYVIPLSKRNDVRSEILMSARQREAFEAMEKNGNADLKKRMKEHFQNLPSPNGKAPEEFRKEFEERAKQSQTLMQQFQSDQDRKFAEILSAKQLQRLKELDLQWRGPLAMSVTEIAESVGITPEQRAQISDLLQDYRKEVSRQMASVFGGGVRFRQPGQPKQQGQSKEKGNESGTESTPQPAPQPAPPSTPEEWRLRAEKASKQIEKTRKMLGDKALALLSAEQKQTWMELQGRAFRFRLID